jgi:hypothetical protein
VQAQKRSWLYSGIAHPPSIVLAQTRKRKRLPAGSRLLLAGDEHAWGLAPFLGLLARDADVSFSTCLHQGTGEHWVREKLLSSAVAPGFDMVLVSLDVNTERPSERAALAQLVSSGRPAGVTLVWLRQPSLSDNVAELRSALDALKVPSFHSEALALPRGPDGQPSARGYAGWAGALWQWIG